MKGTLKIIKQKEDLNNGDRYEGDFKMIKKMEKVYIIFIAVIDMKVIIKMI